MIDVSDMSDEDFRILCDSVRAKGYKMQSVPGDGKYQLAELEDDAPDMELVAQALRNLIAIERDRRLGYAYEDLHMDPVKALENGMVALHELGEDPCDVVWEKDREKLGLENPWDDFTDGEGPELV